MANATDVFFYIRKLFTFLKKKIPINFVIYLIKPRKASEEPVLLKSDVCRHKYTPFSFDPYTYNNEVLFDYELLSLVIWSESIFSAKSSSKRL